MRSEKKNNAVNWFEIPVVDMKRATAFYQAVIDHELKAGEDIGRPMAMFPYREDLGGAGGSLVVDQQQKPGTDGTTIYLAVHDVKAAVARAKEAGGRILVPHVDIGEMGDIALVIDTEGNKIGLHSEKR